MSATILLARDFLVSGLLSGGSDVVSCDFAAAVPSAENALDSRQHVCYTVTSC